MTIINIFLNWSIHLQPIISSNGNSLHNSVKSILSESFYCLNTRCTPLPLYPPVCAWSLAFLNTVYSSDKISFKPTSSLNHVSVTTLRSYSHWFTDFKKSLIFVLSPWLVLNLFKTSIWWEVRSGEIGIFLKLFFFLVLKHSLLICE